jgi:predicted nucleic acid-binding Zn ribbon protein
MDNIDRIMKEADRLGFGCSYGKYRVAYPDSIEDAGAAAPKIPPKPEKNCKCCGASFVPNHANQVYCSPECKDKIQVGRIRKSEQKRKGEAKRTAPKKFCKTCGSDIPISSQRRSYCCDECAAEGSRKYNALRRAANKKED